MIFKCTVDKTLISFNRTMVKGPWRILFMMVLFSRSYLYEKIQVYCFWKFMHKLRDNPWLYINCFQFPLFQCIIIESGISFDGCQEEGGKGCMFQKKGGDEKRKGGGGWYTFPHYEKEPYIKTGVFTDYIQKQPLGGAL